MTYLTIIILVLSLSGLFGGLVNFFISDKDNQKVIDILASIVLGLVASFMVPLFLNTISSNLLEQIRGSESNPGDPLKYFVLAGFCLAAAISSRVFIRTISESVIKELKKTGETAKKAEREVLDVKNVIEPIISKETENEPDEIKDIKDTKLAEMSEDQRKILKAMAEGKFVLRSLSGIANDTSLARELVNKAINELISKGFVEQREREKGPRWFITNDGRKKLEAP